MIANSETQQLTGSDALLLVLITGFIVPLPTLRRRPRRNNLPSAGMRRRTSRTNSAR
jgi:hypothetical protein